jgi:hypothetical protein
MRSYVTRGKPTSGVKKSLQGWESKVGPDGYMSLQDYNRNPNGPTLAELKILYPALKRRFQYVL